MWGISSTAARSPFSSGEGLGEALGMGVLQFWLEGTLWGEPPLTGIDSRHMIWARVLARAARP